MATSFNGLLIFTLVACATVLILSIYPGMLQNFVVAIALTFLGLFLILAIAIALIMLWFQRQHPSAKRALIRLGGIFVTLVCSFGLLKFYVPRRIGFFLSRPAFEAWLAAQPVGKMTGKKGQSNLRSLNTKLGLYSVDQHATDSQSGQYFRVYNHGDGLGPDTVSYGFAYHPNPKESPFGSAYYAMYPLGDGWFWFQASNDW